MTTSQIDLTPELRTQILDLAYTYARRLIREKGGGMLTTEQALALMKNDKEIDKQIKTELANKSADELDKIGLKVIAEKHRSGKLEDWQDAGRMIDELIHDMSSPD